MAIILLILSLFLAGCKQSDGGIDESVNENEQVVHEEAVMRYDSELLDETFNRASEISNIRNLSVSQSGVTIKTEYYNLCKPHSKNNVFSDTKSITSLLIGIAIDLGYIESVDQKVGEFIDLAVYQVDESVESLTLHHLLTMGSGLEWNSANLGNEYVGLKAALEPLEYILERDVTFEPGQNYNYSDGTAYLVSVILYEATGVLPLDFANQYLFEALDIEDVRWTQSRNGVNYGGFDLHLNASDMQKIGQMVLNGGMYNEQRIVSEEWIKLSTSPIVNSPSSSMHNNKYGYFWWVGHKYGYDMFEAVGHGGQFIFIIPDLELIITSSAIGAVEDTKAGQTFSEIESMIVNDVIPNFVKGADK